MTYPSGTTAAYGFDAENRMTSAVLPSANWDTETRQFVTLTPARIADTTTGAGTCDGAPCAPLVADDPVAITVAGQSRRTRSRSPWSVPAGYRRRGPRRWR